MDAGLLKPHHLVFSLVCCIFRVARVPDEEYDEEPRPAAPDLEPPPPPPPPKAHPPQI